MTFCKPPTQDWDDPSVPDITAAEFHRWLATHSAATDLRLSADTLRLMIRDFQMHARRLLGQDAKEDLND